MNNYLVNCIYYVILYIMLYMIYQVVEIFNMVFDQASSQQIICLYVKIH